MPFIKYVPYEQLGDAPNVIVDGAANDHTVLTLSHWPHSGTPADLADDLSAQIVFRYLDRPDRARADIVSNNHIDEDGLVSVWAMVNPEEAQRRRDLLIDVAAAGDFGTYRERRAARIAFAISAYADPDQSPLGHEVATLDYAEFVATLFNELLPQLGELCDHIDARRELWEAEDAILTESEAGIVSGAVTIDEVPAIDLAVVTVPEDWDRRRVHRFTQRRTEVIHPNGGAQCDRLLARARRARPSLPLLRPLRELGSVRHASRSRESISRRSRRVYRSSSMKAGGTQTARTTSRRCFGSEARTRAASTSPRSVPISNVTSRTRRPRGTPTER